MVNSTTVSLLHCMKGRGKRRFSATKTWCRSLGGEPMCIGFSAGMYFWCQPYRVAGIDDLYRLLSKLEHRLDMFLIRGFPHESVDLEQPVRRMKRPDKRGKTWFEERTGQPVVCLDIDKKPAPAGMDAINNPKAAMTFLVENCLPPYLRDVSFVGQWSSSTGMKGQGLLSAHLWFWLDRPMTEAELKAWFNGEPWFDEHESHIDPALFRLVQPHYTAAPIFDGLSDPLPTRVGLGRRTKEVARLSIPEQPHATNSTGRSGPSGRHAGVSPSHNYDVLSSAHGFEAKLALMGDGSADGIRLQGFHCVITSAVASYVATHGKNFDRAALKQVIRNVIDAAPKRAGRDDDVARYASNEYLDDAIDSAIERFGERQSENAEGHDAFDDTQIIDGIPPAFP